MKPKALALVLALALLGPAQAAEIEIDQTLTRTIVAIEGAIQYGDAATFRSKTAHLTGHVIVGLGSDGGQLLQPSTSAA
jgi:hypothetical protein